MRYAAIFLLVLSLFACSNSPYKLKEVNYKEISKEFRGYGFAKSLNKEMALQMAETNARKNIAEQIVGIRFSYTNLNNKTDIRFNIGPMDFEGLIPEQNITLQSTGLTISIFKMNSIISKPIGKGVIFNEMEVQFSDDLLKVSKSRTNVITTTIQQNFPRAHEVKGVFYITDVKVNWNKVTGVVQYKESYSIVVESAK